MFSVQFSHNCVWLFATPWTAARQASLSIANSSSLLKLMSIESVIPSNHLILCCPLLLLPYSFPASGCFQMRQFFTSGGQSIGVSASTSVPPMNTQDWSPLGWTGWISLQSKGLSSLLQHHSSKASILQCLVRAGFVDYRFRVFCGFSKRFHRYDNLSQTNGGNKNGGQANRLHEWKIKSVHLALRRGRLAALGNWAGCKYHTCWH